MDHIGIDVHKMDSQICIVGEGGELRELRIRTTPERFGKPLRSFGPPWVRIPLPPHYRRS